MLQPQSLAAARRHALTSVAARVTATAIVRRSAAYTQPQSRSLLGWRRPNNYANKDDPAYYRSCKYRTLKTRAKLLETRHRRGRWDWNVIASKRIRYASHVGRPSWYAHKGGEDAQGEKPEEIHQDDGFELSQREKKWKEQMEAMRKRIEQDPYEAVFGQRFEPFWAPLVASWRREDTGLQGWPTPKSATPAQPAATSSKAESAETEQSSRPAEQRQPLDSEPASRNRSDVSEGQLTNSSYGSEKAPRPGADSPNAQPTSYSYGLSTSWDSWTKKARGEEWDSVSGKTRRYEYDPISNRMVPVEAPGSDQVEVTQLDSELKGHPRTSQSPLTDHSSKSKWIEKAKPEEGEGSRPRAAPKSLPKGSRSPLMAHGVRSVLTEKSSETVDVPVKTSFEVRKAITVPTQNSEGKETSVYFPSLLNTSVHGHRAKPPAIARVPEKDVEALTAEGVRASVGEFKSQTAVKQSLQNEFNGPVSKLDSLVRDAGRDVASEPATSKETSRPCVDRIQGRETAKWTPEEVKRLEGSRKLGNSGVDIVSQLGRSSQKPASEATDLDDSAAHESTSDFGDVRTNVPRDWDKQAELLQAGRVRRTRDDAMEQAGDDILSMRKSGVRWVNMVDTRTAKYDSDKAEQKTAAESRDAEKNARLEKADALLEAEIQEHRFRMQAHENRHAHKSRPLRQELDTAHKQSSTNAEMHVDRIEQLEQELEKAQQAAGGTSKIDKYQSESDRYRKKIAELRKELDIAFKQSSTALEKHVERIQKLEKEVDKARKRSAWTSRWEKHIFANENQSMREGRDSSRMGSSTEEEKHLECFRTLEGEFGEARKQAMPAEATHAEGDMSANVAKYARDTKSYQQPAAMPRDRKLDNELVKYEQKKKKKKQDQDLVSEARDIYKKRYDTPDVNHCQTKAIQPRAQLAKEEPHALEVESDTEVDKALADYENEQTYKNKPDNLEAELVAQEKEAHEAQALMDPDSNFKKRQTVEPDAPQVISARSTEQSTKTQESCDITWEAPPLYKILAYDSGNDSFSIATTSTNFTGKERPISIVEALSQLYQPARFVSHFAELQKEGFQVIHGTKDLLVFKKVARPKPSLATATTDPFRLGDHSLTKAPASKKSAGVNTTEPETRSFASRTVVGDRRDNIISSEGIVQSPSTVSSAKDTSTSRAESSALADSDAASNIGHHAHIRREGRVFSGRSLNERATARGHHHEPSPKEVQDMKKWKTYRRRFRLAVLTGLGASALAYGIGAKMERDAREKRKENWERILGSMGPARRWD